MPRVTPHASTARHWPQGIGHPRHQLQARRGRRWLSDLGGRIQLTHGTGTAPDDSLRLAASDVSSPQEPEGPYYLQQKHGRKCNHLCQCGVTGGGGGVEVVHTAPKMGATHKLNKTGQAEPSPPTTPTHILQVRAEGPSSNSNSSNQLPWQWPNQILPLAHWVPVTGARSHAAKPSNLRRTEPTRTSITM